MREFRPTLAYHESRPTRPPSADALISIGGTMAQQTVNYGGIHIHGQPGTPNQNQDLTDRLSKTLEQHATKLQYENMRKAMKPGGILYGAKRGSI